VQPLLVKFNAEIDNKAYNEEYAEAASADRVEGRPAFVCELDRDAEQVGTPDHISHFCEKFRHL